MLKATLMISALLAATPASAETLGGAACPETWRHGDRVLKLGWAETWGGSTELDAVGGKTRDGKDWEEPETTRKFDEVFWDMQNIDKPAFMLCQYGDSKVMSEGPTVIVPIPDDARKCHRAWRDAGDTVYVTAISCSPGKAPVPPISVVERISLQTDLDGLTLRQSRDALMAVAAGRGGIWRDGSDGRRAEVTFPARGTRYRIAFSAATGLSREIAQIGPPRNNRSDFVFAIERRFGGFRMNPWRGDDNVIVEHFFGKLDDKPVPQELRLVDMNDPESQRERQR